MRIKIANNYSGLKNRDKKLYSISGTKVSSTGLSYKFIKVFSWVFISMNMFGVLICMIGGQIYYWPFKGDLEIKPGFLVFFVGGPFLITMALLHMKIQRYNLLDYLVAYFTPKYVRDHNGKRIKYRKYKQDTVFERIL